MSGVSDQAGAGGEAGSAGPDAQASGAFAERVAAAADSAHGG